MSSVEDNPIGNNKDIDEDIDDAEVWSDEYLQIVISNQLIDNKDNTYINQAKEKYQYFRINSPSVVYDIDVVDLSDQIIKHFEDIIGHNKTIEQKHNRLNSIFAASIYLIYKNQVLPRLLSTTSEDPVIVRSRINEMPSLVSGKWRLTDSSKKLQTSGSCLSEIIGYVSSLSPITKEASTSNKNSHDDIDDVYEEEDDIPEDKENRDLKYEPYENQNSTDNTNNKNKIIKQENGEQEQTEGKKPKKKMITVFKLHFKYSYIRICDCSRRTIFHNF